MTIKFPFMICCKSGDKNLREWFLYIVKNSSGSQFTMQPRTPRKKQLTVRFIPETEDEIVDKDHPESSTLISGKEMLARKTTKQIKRKKTTVRKSEKSLNILDKKVEKMKSNSASFDNFISKIQEWMRIKAGIAKQMFELIDREGEGLLTYDQFKAGMFDMRVPATKVELHLLCRLLDTNDNGKIDYKHLENILQSVRQIRDSELEQFNEHQLLLATSQKTLPCPCCPMLRVEPTKDLESRCILLELRAIAFDMVNNHPGHFKILVHSKLPVCGLVQTIISQTGISSTKLAIFYDKTRFAESVLSPNMTLEECGFIGDFKGCPEEVTLFYDYTVEFTECPLLMSDFYFE